MLSCNGPLSKVVLQAFHCILNFFFFFCLQFGSPGGMRCPSSFVMCLLWNAPHGIQTPPDSAANDREERSSSSTQRAPGHRLTARLKVCVQLVHSIREKKKITSAAGIFHQRGCSGTIFCMKHMIWKPKSQLQKRHSSGVFFSVRFRSTSKRNGTGEKQYISD